MKDIILGFVLGAVLMLIFRGCAHGPTLAPLPPLPGPNISDWQMHATCRALGVDNADAHWVGPDGGVWTLVGGRVVSGPCDGGVP